MTNQDTSCLGPLYNPRPTRQWNRFVPNRSDPINGESFTVAQNRKGNILQYKKNSSNLTWNKKYALIAQGRWVNKKSYATQSDKYTDFNNGWLKQQNNAFTTAVIPISNQHNCNPPTKSNKVLIPTNHGGPTPPSTPIIPPVPPPPITPSSNPLLPPSIPDAVPPEPTVIPDGGSLNSCQIYNYCENKIIKQFTNNFCNSTRASDVPDSTVINNNGQKEGRGITLCYNPAKHPTYYPRTRTTYLAGGNKWPTNAKPVFSANNTPPQVTPSLIPSSFPPP